MSPEQFPEPGSPVLDPAIYGPAGPNGEPPHMTMSQFQQWQRDEMARNIAATPAPPGYDSYADYLAGKRSVTPVIASSRAFASTPAPAPIAAVATPAPTVHHFNLRDFLSIMLTLAPAVASPFIKNPTTAAIVASEVPIAQALAAALSR